MCTRLRGEGAHIRRQWNGGVFVPLTDKEEGTATRTNADDAELSGSDPTPKGPCCTIPQKRKQVSGFRVHEETAPVSADSAGTGRRCRGDSGVLAMIPFWIRVVDTETAFLIITC